jgi:hypothetical protein
MKQNYLKNHAEQCLLNRYNHNGHVVICVYVDDCLITGNREAVDLAVADIESTFEVRRLGPLEEYIGCTIQKLPDASKKIIQPDMIKKLAKTFGYTVINLL